MSITRGKLAILTALFIGLSLIGVAAPSSAAGMGVISGTVTDSAGDPIAGIQILLIVPSQEPGHVGEAQVVDSADSAVDGTYSFSSYAFDDYSLQFRDLTNVYAAESREPLTITTGGTTTVDVTLDRASTISGVVTNPDGTPSIATDVFVHRNTDTGWRVVGGNFTNRSGFYTVDGLKAGIYRLQFGSSPTTDISGPEFYENANSLATAKDLSILEGTTTTGIDAQLPPGVTISGVITNRANNRVNNILVSAYRIVDGQAELAGGNSTTRNGEYRVYGLPAGTYVFQVGPTTSYAAKWWPNASRFADAERFDIEAGDRVERNVTVDGAGKHAPKVKARVFAKFDAKKLAAGKASRVRASLDAPEVQPTGKLLVLDGRRVIQRLNLKQSWGGQKYIQLKPLRRGMHKLRVKYSGNVAVTPAVSKVTRIRVR